MSLFRFLLLKAKMVLPNKAISITSKYEIILLFDNNNEEFVASFYFFA